MIPWRPIAELPDALKDGREVLFAFEYENATVNPGAPNRLYDVGRFYAGQLITNDPAQRKYAANDGKPTHFAEIASPEAPRAPEPYSPYVGGRFVP